MTVPRGVSWYLRVERSDRSNVPAFPNVPVFQVSGRLGHETSRTLVETLSDAVADGGSSGVVVNLTAVDYLSSAGLRALGSLAARLAVQRRELILCGLRDSVRLTLSFAGCPPNVAIESSEELAIRRAAGSPNGVQQPGSKA